MRAPVHTPSLWWHRIILLLVLCVPSVWMNAQKKSAGKKVRIDLLHADDALADKLARPDVQVLKGDVRLKHNEMYMYCDSALIFEKINSVEAYGNVRMEQGDTLFIYGDYAYYDGISQLAMLRENVRLINRKTELRTDSLNYDRVYNLGYYFDGGSLSDEENLLTSILGEYNLTTKLAKFNEEVKLTNPRFVLTSDTLHYSTMTKVATIVGPSHIEGDKSHVYSDLGTYNTITEQGRLYNRSLVISEGRKLTGDTLFYDKKRGFGEAFSRVVLNDTINKNMLRGNYCWYDEVRQNALATKRAVAIDYSQGDSLFVHADTLRLYSYFLNTDSVYRETHAYHKVRAYRTDVQAVCDSVVFCSKDSCMTMYRDPVIWNQNQQLLGEQIKVYMNDSTINWAHVINQALTIEKFDSIHYNQLAGREIKAFFDKGEIRLIEVNGNVQTIYFPMDDKDSTLIGQNNAEGSFLRMLVRNKKMEYGAFIGKTTGTLYPLDQVPADKARLHSFVWLTNIRPRNKDDIFDWKEKNEDQKLKKIDRGNKLTPRQMRIERTNTKK